MVGHSVGEFAAAAVADIMTLDDAAMLVATRGRLMQELPVGAMLAVRLSEDELLPLVNKCNSDSAGQIEIAAVNGPEMCVVSGPTNAIDRFATDLESGTLGTSAVVTRLRTSHAFHSAMMDPAVDRFRGVLSKVTLSPPQIPIVSTVTARELSADEATDIEYWAFQIRKPVRFSSAIQSVIGEQKRVLLEVGPNQALSSLTRQQSLDPKLHTVLSTLPHVKQEVSAAHFAMGTLGRLWLAGVELDWNAIYESEPRRRVHLPTYRFEEKRYWFEVNESTAEPCPQPVEMVAPVEVNQPNGVHAATNSNLNGKSNGSAIAAAACQKEGSNEFAVQVIQQQLHMLHRQVEILRNRTH
jgi:acyl transferase domain-containing protein